MAAHELRATATLFVAVLTLIAAWGSIYMVRKTWLDTYRPIVAARVETLPRAGDGSIPYNLVVYNSGNRPAKEIRLHADESFIQSCFGGFRPGE